ncbi:CocE/NonD family hydrolase [Catenulispora pinisilvae]|uniref:CocE/NonD family hydrolase n=1 Tax=Catenulispora pinisilvae TaxID=2705253 RepID=UPI001E51704E|nr:CocE/NonD family hydrolase [Catenulispora pinisilvae]
MDEIAETTAPDLDGPFRVDVVGDMTIEWDVPIVVDDGNVLRADVFRPTAPGDYPVVLTYGPYGKGKPFREYQAESYRAMLAMHPEIAEGTSGKYQVFELVDPDRWVPDGYALVRVDSRGAGRSPGVLDPLSEREIRDLYECVEWAGSRSWSNGKVGLNGISYFAMNAWQVATLRPPHLAAVVAWEGAADWYRDVTYHGGIHTTFENLWYGAIAGGAQHGLGERGGRNPITGQLVCGDQTLSPEELAANRVDMPAIDKSHPLVDDHHRARTRDLSQIRVPLLSAGNWGGLGLHLRGNTRGFELAGSDQKWLAMHDETHFSLFYADYGVDLQKRFLGHFLKAEDNGWDEQPRVHLRTRHADGRVGERVSSDWPLPETQWTRLYLSADHGLNADHGLITDHGSMTTTPAPDHASVSYSGKEGRAAFSYVVPADIELAGPVGAKLFVESSTADADLFLVLRAFAPDGTEVTYQGANDPHVPISQGWLRASHRAVDPQRSRPFLPLHPHDRVEPLKPGTIYEVDVEILPTSLMLPAGFTLALDVQAHDYVHRPAVEEAEAHANPRTSFTGSGPFLHADPTTRPDEVYAGTVTVHTGPEYASHLILPVISD